MTVSLLFITKWLFHCFSSTGNCSMSIRRWYFNLKSQQCEEFVYTGCLGNGNNFASLFVCQEKCTVGACCQRAQSRSGVIGYTPDGYDKWAVCELLNTVWGTSHVFIEHYVLFVSIPLSIPRGIYTIHLNQTAEFNFTFYLLCLRLSSHKYMYSVIQYTCLLSVIGWTFYVSVCCICIGKICVSWSSFKHSGWAFDSWMLCQVNCVKVEINIFVNMCHGCYVRYGFTQEGVHRDGHSRSPGENARSATYDDEGYDWQGTFLVGDCPCFCPSCGFLGLWWSLMIQNSFNFYQIKHPFSDFPF